MPLEPPRARLPFVSLGTKTVLALVVVLALSAVATAYQLSNQTRERLVEGKLTAATMVVELFSASVLPALDFDDDESLRTEVEKLGGNADIVYAAVFRPGAGEPVAELSRARGFRASRPLSAGTRVLPDRIEVTRLLTGQEGKALGSLAVHVSLAPENERFLTARRSIIQFAALSTFVAAVVITLISRRLVTAPLKGLSDAALRLEQGKAQLVEVRANDEVGQLATAFNSMAAAIVDRERRLAELNHELQQLLDNMRQAIVVFGPQGQLSPIRSRQAEVLFSGSETDGASVQALLYPGKGHDVAAEAFREWLGLAFVVPREAWEEVGELAPKDVVVGAGKTERVLALDFRPIEVDGKVEKIMLLATDETEVRALERTVKAQDEEHEKQMAAMRRLVAGGGQLLVSVLERAEGRLSACEGLAAEAAGDLESGLVEQLFQHVHSVKGEARAFDLSVLETASAELEDFLAILRGRLREGQKLRVEDIRADLVERLQGARAAVSRAGEMLVEASPIGAAILQQVTVQRGDVERLLEVAGGRQDQIGRLVSRLSSRPFGELLLGLAEAVPRWATREGKRARIEVEGREVLVPPRVAEALPGVMTHLLRNAVAHGVEATEDRIAAGKDEIALIRIVAEDGPLGPSILVEDDGRGLDAEAIAEKARDLGVRGEVNPARAVFTEGLSTAAVGGALAGYGVGLGAVRADLSAVGYSITLASASPGLRISLVPDVDQRATPAESRGQRGAS